MAREVTLPELGESVEEGIITQWLVEVGDLVEVDQPLVEISTDKVDTEIPSPVAGTVQELRGDVDDTIAVGDVILVVGEDADGADGGDSSTGDDAAGGGADDGAADGDEPPAAAPPPEPATAGAGDAPARGDVDVAAGEGVLTSPLVRRLLREAEIDPSSVEGTGPGGRITRQDAESAIERGPREPAAAAPVSTAAGGAPPAPARPTASAPAAAPSAPPPPAPSVAGGTPDRPSPGTVQIDFGGDREVAQDISRVRRAIANGMRNSLATTAQLTAVVEVDMTRVMNLRAATKDGFKAQHGASLSPLPFIMRAVAMTLQRHPILNSTLDMESGTATFKRYVNLGMAVDTERGLLVPNIKNAEDLTVAGLAKRIGELARATRGKGLKPDDIVGGTFTVTNTGSLGTLLDTPIVNPPEVGILGAAAIEKRPVVVSDGYGDSIAIRWMTYLCLSYDHMALDGADAARFLQDLKWTLENHDFTGELSASDVGPDDPARGIDPGESYVALTTYRGNGAMVTTPVWFVDGPDVLRVLTDADAGKVRRVHADPRVAVAACDVRGHVTGPTVHGTAVVERSPEVLTGLIADLQRKYGLVGQAFTRVRSAIGREPDRAQLRITIDG